MSAGAFQFTPARGGRRRGRAHLHRGDGFNSRPRVAGDAGVGRPVRHLAVSIHARAWRATAKEWRGGILETFQFTPARGGRPIAACPAIDTMLVSIHARAWRATSEPAEADAARRFNSRPRVAGDCVRSRETLPLVFQFTPARGGRHRGLPGD